MLSTYEQPSVGICTDYFIIFVGYIKCTEKPVGQDMNTSGKMRIPLIIGKTLLWIAGIWFGLMVVLQIVLSPAVLTKIVNKVAVEFVDGEIAFGKASVSVFRHFPKITLNLEDFAVTYPAERFDSLERAGVQGHMLYHGTAEISDTLASFKKFSASVSLLPLLKGDISIPNVSLVKPRIFAHYYDENNANWNIFKMGEEEKTEEDTTSTAMPDIIISKVSLTEHPHIVYTDNKDTVFAMIDLKHMLFDGKINTGNIPRVKLGLRLDSMIVAGRVGRDTLALGLDALHIHEHNRHMDMHAQAKTMLATRAFGRMQIPIDITGSIAFPKDSVTAVAVRDLKADIASIPLRADAVIRLHSGRTRVDGTFGINNCKVQDILSGYIRNFIPEVDKVNTDAVIALDAKVNGFYEHSTGKLPVMDIKFSVPDSKIEYSDFPEAVKLSIEAEAEATEEGQVNARLAGLSVNTVGVHLMAKAGAADLLGADPLLDVDGTLTAAFDSLQTFIPDTMNVSADGILTAKIAGKAKMSQLDLYNFSNATLSGEVTGKGISLVAPEDTIDVKIDSLGLWLGPETIKSRRSPDKEFKLLALNGYISKADIAYKDALGLNGKDLTLSVKNTMPEDEADTSRVLPLSGRIGAKALSVKDSEGSSVALDETANTFRMMPKKGQKSVPVLSFSSKNKRITLITSANRAILTDSEISASAAMNTFETKARRQAFMDSLARVYPDIPKDSLFRHMMSQRTQRAVPDWMKEEDFKKNDLDLKLDETLAKYFREWDLNGNINIRTGIVMTPYFPLRNILRGFECGFNNNEIRIDSIKFVSGNSEIGAKGALTGLKRALLGRGTVKLDLDIMSNGMDGNELLRAYSAGASFDPEASKDKFESASNSDFLKMVTTDTTVVSEAPSLIVIPANLNAEINLDASNITYSDLNVSKATADIIMKERCVQITNTAAETNMGRMSFDAFYSTRTKNDLKTGFSLNLEDITAEKVISLMPQVDTLIPLLKSFKGLLNCEIAATAKIDTSMNLIMPSINGVMRISGENLSVSDNELYRTLAKKLLFRNKKEGHIDKMMVEGVIKDNVMEIFPFILKVDRYTLAMSGIQNLDMSFKYHVSVIKCPFLIKLGIDLSGPDFDNMKFRIGKAKYKNTRIPVFSTVIDDTKINLLSSIQGIFEKGVDAAIRENEMQKEIAARKEELGYINAVDMELEELSEKEQKQMEADEAVEEAAQAANAELQAALQDIADKVAEELAAMEL